MYRRFDRPSTCFTAAALAPQKQASSGAMDHIVMTQKRTADRHDRVSSHALSV